MYALADQRHTITDINIINQQDNVVYGYIVNK